MSDPVPSSEPRPKLHSLAGAEAPEGLAADLDAVGALPQSARDGLWTLLEQNLGPTVDDSVEAEVDRFCAQHGVSQEALVPVVRGCRRLFRLAAGSDLAVELVAEDLKALCGAASETTRVLLACYAKALPLIRTQNIVALMTEFGAVLDDVRIRLDYVPATRHDGSKVVPIALMSLRYREGDERKHLAVQAPLELLVQLKRMCDAILT